MTTRKELYRLVDQLPDQDLDMAARLLVGLLAANRPVDPLPALLEAAPIDDEPLTEEERAAHQRGRESFRQGKGRMLKSHEPKPGARPRVRRDLCKDRDVEVSSGDELVDRTLNYREIFPVLKDDIADVIREARAEPSYAYREALRPHDIAHRKKLGSGSRTSRFENGANG